MKLYAFAILYSNVHTVPNDTEVEECGGFSITQPNLEHFEVHKYNVLPGLRYLAPSRHWRFKVMSNDVKPLAYFTKVFYQVLLGIFSACCHQTVQRLLVFLLHWLSSQQSGLLPQSRLMTLSPHRVFVQLRTERFTIMLLFMCEISPWGSVKSNRV